MLLKEKAIIVSLIVCTAIHSICYAEEAENVISAEFDSEIENFTYKNIKQALTDVANNENYQLLCECAQWVQSNKDALGVAKVQEFQRLLHQRLSELVGYRDGFLHSHRGAVGLLAIGSIVSTLFYKRKMKFTYYYDAKSSITANLISSQSCLRVTVLPIFLAAPGLLYVLIFSLSIGSVVLAAWYACSRESYTSPSRVTSQ